MTIFAVGLIVGLLLGGGIVGIYDVRVSRRQIRMLREACQAHRVEQQQRLNEMLAECEKMQKKIDAAVRQ